MRRILTALTVIALLAACNGDDEPKEPTKTPTPSATATPPPLPKQAKEDSPEGAAAFAFYFVSVVNAAAASGDTDQMRALSAGCRECAKYADAIETTVGKGEHASGDIWEVKQLEVAMGSRVVTARLTIAARRESGPYTFPLNLELPPHPPFEVRDMYRREQ